MISTNTKSLLPLTGLLLLSVPGLAQDAAEAAQDAGGNSFYDDFFTLGLLALGAVVIVAALAAMFQLLNAMIRIQQIKIYQEAGMEAMLEQVQKPRKSLWDRLYKRWTKVVPVEKEEDILFDHEYDGIRELDNSLPPWWVAMFYITIAFAVIYMTYYHFAGIGKSSAEQYQAQMEQAEADVQAYLAKQANLVDETNVTLLSGDAELAAGEAIFQTNCASCHGQLGEGGIGPNMTDAYWVHGGSINDVFKTIKYGVPEKGMISWKAQLRPAQMQQVASYILSLQGTNPPNAKEAEGELYQPEQVENQDGMQGDTTANAEASIGMLQEE